ncbi:PorT family protein [Polaribacter pectinis]|uniref:PorT family protein n=1 Tax=Polaribacter pectinis TaxID=2738844 RepID=A0A7G9L805_9FLAO|nr:porin family protein [Polaribacter pectinis]QNM84754.1 PorT family protein [Polaribacter pectinis]
MSKRFLIFGFFLLSSIAFFAQSERVEYLPSFDKKRLHYGFYLGLNKNDFKLNLRESSVPNADISVEPTSGFNVGLIADLRLHKNLNLRLEPGLVSNSKRILFNHLKGSSTPKDSIREIGSTYLHLPLVFKFSTDRYKNVRPYVLGGISYDYNFSSNEANQDDNSAGQFRMQTHNFMYEVGIGIDIYLYYFKFSPSIRGVFAMNNEIKYDDDPNSKWTAPVNYMGTRGIFLTFAFE